MPAFHVECMTCTPCMLEEVKANCQAEEGGGKALKNRIKFDGHGAIKPRGGPTSASPVKRPPLDTRSQV